MINLSFVPSRILIAAVCWSYAGIVFALEEQHNSHIKMNSFLTTLAAMRSVGQSRLEEYQIAPSSLSIDGGAKGATGPQGSTGQSGFPGPLLSYSEFLETPVSNGALIPIPSVLQDQYPDRITIFDSGYYLINYTVSVKNASQIDGQYFEISLNDGCMPDSVTYNGTWTGIKYLSEGDVIGLRNISSCSISNMTVMFWIVQIHSSNVG